MKKLRKILTLAGCFSIVFIFFPTLAHAQPDPCTDPFAYCPIDGGLSFLLAAGIGYGIKRVKDAGKKESASTHDPA